MYSDSRYRYIVSPYLTSLGKSNVKVPLPSVLILGRWDNMLDFVSDFTEVPSAFQNRCSSGPKAHI